MEEEDLRSKDLQHSDSSLKNNNIKEEEDNYQKHDHDVEEDPDRSSSLELQNVSKLILPPLGASTYNPNPVLSKGWIISPMDSRYRYNYQFSY